MVTGIKFTGDMKQLIDDLERFNDNFESLSSYDFGEMTNKIAQYYKNTLNNDVARTAPSLAKARVHKRTRSNKSYSTIISIPIKTIQYEEAPLRTINLKSNKGAREWVKRNWKWSNTGWHPTQKWANRSIVRGGYESPKGTLVVMSRKLKGYGSALDRTDAAVREEAKRQMREKVPIIFNRVGKRMFGKRIYKINYMNTLIGGK